jgi:hypothetical protein
LQLQSHILDTAETRLLQLRAALKSITVRCCAA